MSKQRVKVAPWFYIKNNILSKMDSCWLRLKRKGWLEEKAPSPQVASKLIAAAEDKKSRSDFQSPVGRRVTIMLAHILIA
jgi:hypothetical protein